MRRAIITLLTALAAAGGARAQAPAPVLTLVDTAILAAPRLDESSGVVESRRRPGVFWTHNDSGDRAFLYATDSLGTDLGRVLVRGAQNVDWEDVALGPCPRSAGNCLFVGDIGDNQVSRRMIQVYVVPEPEPPQSAADTSRTVDLEAVIDLRYPDRPHNAEALAVSGTTLLLVTKDRTGPATLFRAPTAGAPSGMLERVGDLAMETSFIRGRVATGAGVSNDGRLLAVRTYVSMHLFALDHDNVPLTLPSGITLPVVEPQGEGICFDHEGRVILTSESGVHGHAILTRLRLEGLRP
jgi:hypothetical protein